jgi:hypothetical protein
MGHLKFLHRFRVNPVEVVVFSGIAVLFCYSVYNLFYGYDDLRSTVRTHWEAGLAVRTAQTARSVASQPDKTDPAATARETDTPSRGLTQATADPAL